MIIVQSGIADVEMTVGLPADRRGTHMSRMVQAVETHLARVNPYELHTAFKAIAGLLDTADLRIALALPVATRVESPATANSGYQVHDLSLRGRLVDGAFRLADHGDHRRHDPVPVQQGDQRLRRAQPAKQGVAVGPRRGRCPVPGDGRQISFS